MQLARSGTSIWRTARLILSTAIIAALIRAFLIAGFTIPSQSMMPGLMVGDFFCASKCDYGWSPYAFSTHPFFHGRLFGSLPRRGDVVILAGVIDPQTTYIKRVMGLPGDVVEMRAGRLILNGKPLVQQPKGAFAFAIKPGVTCLAIPGLIDLRMRLKDGSAGCHMNLWREQLPDGRWHDVTDFAVARSDTMAPVRVPPGRVFLLGDNRDDSLDSRFQTDMGGLGMVPADRILGKARRIVFSSDGTSSLVRPWTWIGAWRLSRVGPIN